MSSSCKDSNGKRFFVSFIVSGIAMATFLLALTIFMPKKCGTEKYWCNYQWENNQSQNCYVMIQSQNSFTWIEQCQVDKDNCANVYKNVEDEIFDCYIIYNTSQTNCISKTQCVYYLDLISTILVILEVISVCSCLLTISLHCFILYCCSGEDVENYDSDDQQGENEANEILSHLEKTTDTRYQN